MITCAAAISYGILFHPCRAPCSSVSSSASRKHFPLTFTHYPIEKDGGRNYFQALEFPRRVSVRAVAALVESDYKVDVWTQNLNGTNALASTFEDVIRSDPKVSSGRKISENERNPKRLSSSASQIKTPDHFPVIRYALGTESAIKAMLECNTLVFVVEKHADKKTIKDEVKKVFKIRAKKVNTSIMPNGTKKAYIMLRPEFKASDVAKKIKIL